MSSPSFQDQLRDCAKDLSEVADAARQGQGTGTLSADSYSFFSGCSTCALDLGAASELLEVRRSAFEVLSDLPKSADPQDPTLTKYHGIKMPFWHARLLAFQSYVSTTWTIYDTAARVAGRLMCTDAVAMNLTKPAKLPEHFIQNDKFVGSRMSHHIRDSYGWPIGFSYAVRNWLIHDGESSGGVTLFEQGDIGPISYRVSDEGWAKLEARCHEVYKTMPTQTRNNLAWPWHRDELHRVLEVCHQEIDEVTGALINWASGSMRILATQLFRRDVR